MTDKPITPYANAARLRVTHEQTEAGPRTVPEETAIALTYGRTTYAVMMATPANLEDFAVGFSLTEGIVEEPGEIVELEATPIGGGIEIRMTLSSDRDAELVARRRRFAGPAGCGLCGIESLEAAVRPPRKVETSLRVASATVFRAFHGLRPHQILNAKTHAVHAAGFWSLVEDGFMAVREDVGRHNALDKLAGALARAHRPANEGFIVLTSRLSIELVQKAAAIGCPVIAAVSVPTAYAIRAAEQAGLTLVAVARPDSFEIFSYAERIGAPAHAE